MSGATKLHSRLRWTLATLNFLLYDTTKTLSHVFSINPESAPQLRICMELRMRCRLCCDFVLPTCSALAQRMLRLDLVVLYLQHDSLLRRFIRSQLIHRRKQKAVAVGAFPPLKMLPVFLAWAGFMLAWTDANFRYQKVYMKANF